MQGVKTAPSRLHIKVEPDLVEVKVKIAEVAFVGLVGCAVILVSGAILSITYESVLIVSKFPPVSLAKYFNVVVLLMLIGLL